MLAYSASNGRARTLTSVAGLKARLKQVPVKAIRGYLALKVLLPEPHKRETQNAVATAMRPVAMRKTKKNRAPSSIME